MATEEEKELWRQDIRESFNEGCESEKSRILFRLENLRSIDQRNYYPSEALPSTNRWPFRPLSYEEQTLIKKLIILLRNSS